ncbi:hypothetical protein Vafri_3839 [Volvox africanus]|uniref:Eukaryotic translation initiation factor 3 subunit E n=1 Tax=Volvox africanus TaxID=51714 RepID=A0A8J4ASW3_9CHLO|nr:hypothetical protein Vafri_3839 [Volvox africanus]
MAAAQNYELSSRLVQYLDLHLTLPIMEYLQERGLYNEDDILRAKLALLDKTNMVDFAMDIYKGLNGVDDVPQEMKERRTQVVARLRQLQADVDPIIKCLQNRHVVDKFRQDKSFNLQFLQEEFQIGAEHVEALYQYARFQFNCGNYSLAAELLQSYRTLCTNSERNMSALWGKLAAEILMHEAVNIQEAREDVFKLKEAIDNQTFAPPLVQLQQRTWLLHWSLYVFWNHENGRNDIIELFQSPAYLSAIQINAPHLLRYFAVAVVINKKKPQTRGNVLKDLIRAIQQESYEYSDPVTQFLECVFVQYDFDGAQQKLKECEAVLDNDFFLAAYKDEFIENARLYIFETYCMIHQSISIALLAERLCMDQQAAEKWIANLILNAKLNAKIDSKSGTVVMGTQSKSVHEQLIEKAKALAVKNTYGLANTIVGGVKP